MHRNLATWLSYVIFVSSALATVSVSGAGAPPSTSQPSTRPTVRYDKFNDRTVVSVEMGGLEIGYAFAGREGKGSPSRLIVMTGNTPVPNNELIFLVDGAKRIHLGINQQHAEVSPDWLAQFVEAKSIELNIGTSPDGTALTDVERQRIKGLLELAGYYSRGPTKSGPTIPEFCAVPLQKPSVIFLLDRGNSLSNDFDALKTATFKAIETLGPTRQYQVVLWDNDSGPMAFPFSGLHDATGQSVADVRKYFADSIATGSSRLKGVLKEALSRSPKEIVIATGRIDLDDDDAAALRGLIGKTVRVNAIQIYSVTAPPMGVLQEVCRATGGKYQHVSSAELRAYSN
jgi:hypothetical protein